MSTASKSNIIAIDDNLEEPLGYITYWNTSGEHSFDHIKQYWLSAGLSEDALLSTCSEKVAMRRACDQTCRDLNATTAAAKSRTQYKVVNQRGHNVIVRYDEKDVDPASDEIPLDPKPIAEFWVDRVETGQGKNKTVTYTPINRRGDHFPDVMTHYEHFMDQILARDIGPWLIDVADAMKAVRMRDNGGIYFIPRVMVKKWDKVVWAMKESGCALVQKLPAVDASDAVEAVIDALKTEVSSKLEKMTEELASGELQGRALDTRIAKCRELQEKVAGYAKLIGHIPDLEDQAKDMRRKITHARMQMN